MNGVSEAHFCPVILRLDDDDDDILLVSAMLAYNHLLLLFGMLSAV